MKRVILILAGILLIASATSAQLKSFVPQSDSLVKTRFSPLGYTGKTDRIRSRLIIPRGTIVRNRYYENLGIACKAEFKLEKATKVPFRFRLGSLQQTDYLEQKPNAIKPEK